MKSPLSLSLVACAVLAAPLTAQQNPPVSGKSSVSLNPQTGVQGVAGLVAPDSAALIAGTTGSPFGWLNIVNAPISIADAMTDPDLLASGYANAFAGTTIEVKFATPVTNDAGADLAILDAQFDIGEYSISTDYDGFAASIAVNTAVGDLCGVSDFFYEHNPSGPFPANVVASRFDLSALGVPAGDSVTSVRFTTLNAACDPMTLARIDRDPFTLRVTTLTAGLPGTAVTINGTPGGVVSMSYSLVGPGPSVIPGGPCGAISVDLSAPVNLLVNGLNDPAGSFSYTQNVPAGAMGANVWIQALDVSTCELSNLVSMPIL